MRYLFEAFRTDLRAFPCRIIFVMEADRFEVVLDAGLQIRVKRQVKLDASFNMSELGSGDPGEQRAAKFFVMDNFLGKDGWCLIKKSRENYYIKALLFPGTTQYKAALFVDENGESFVDMGKYLEVMREFGFDSIKSDFSYQRS